MPDDHVAQQYARIPGTARSRYLNGTLHTYCVSHGPARGDLFNQGCVSSMILHPEWLTLLAKRFWSDFVGRSPRTGCISVSETVSGLPIVRGESPRYHHELLYGRCRESRWLVRPLLRTRSIGTSSRGYSD